MFSDLKREDVQLFMSLLKKKVADYDPQFQSIVTQYRTKRDAAESELQALQKKSDDFKAASGASGPKPPGYFSQSLEDFFKLERARSAGSRMLAEAYAQYRKLLDKMAEDVSQAFFAKASS